MWGIHNDQPEIDPLADGAVRIGWDEVGDLSLLAPARDAFKAAVREHRPDIEEGTVPSTAGTLYRFVHELAEGDVVVCPNRKLRTLDIGRVAGPYEFHPELPLHRHRRPINWVRTGVDRGELSVSAQNEVSAATTLFAIATAEDEIAHLMATPSRDDIPDFSWTQFYPRLVTALLDYRDDRPALLERIWNVATASGRPKLFKYLQADRYADGGSGPIRDIDPFTVLGTFNRGIREEARADIARALADEFGVTPPHPTRFPGIPIVNNMKSWFFRYEDERDPQQIPALWDLCVAARSYAAGANEESREAFVAAFDACAKGNTRRLSMGLFWVEPDHFAAYDGVNAEFVRAQHPDLAAKLALGARINGDQFLANTETLGAWLADPSSPIDTFAEFSLAAWLYAAQIDSDDGEVAATSGAPSPDANGGIGESTALPPIVEESEPYDAAAIREDGAFSSEGEIEQMLERLHAKKNVVLQGPPGTGKTWLARRLGWALCDERGSARVRVVQFHPSLSYEDFVRGWRPAHSAGLELADGPFLDICTAAAADPASPYVLVIEEINRGNPAQILGELLTLMEADKRTPEYAMRLAYPRPGELFHIPPNVHVIGTMNVADRSLAIVDMALRRRFAFIDLTPKFGDDWIEHVSGLGYDRDLLETYATRLVTLNDAVAMDTALGKQFGIGHSYFTPGIRLEDTGLDTQQWWHRVVSTDIRPLLEEYWFDRPDHAANAVKQLLGGA